MDPARQSTCLGSGQPAAAPPGGTEGGLRGRDPTCRLHFNFEPPSFAQQIRCPTPIFHFRTTSRRASHSRRPSPMIPDFLPFSSTIGTDARLIVKVVAFRKFLYVAPPSLLTLPSLVRPHHRLPHRHFEVEWRSGVQLSSPTRLPIRNSQHFPSFPSPTATPLADRLADKVSVAPNQTPLRCAFGAQFGPVNGKGV